MFNIPTQRLAKVTVTETTTAVTLSVNPIVIAALSFTPRHLLVRAEMLAVGSTYPNIYTRFNGDTGSNYNVQVLTGYGTTKAAGRYTESGLGLLGNIGPNANQWTPGEILLPDALSTRTHKSALSYSGRYEAVVRTAAGRWASTAAITSVTLYAAPDSQLAPFAAGSTFELCVVDESFNINEQILGSDGTFTVSSISAADGDLVVIGNLRTDRGTDADTMKLHFNSDTTSGNYYRQRLYGSGTSTGATSDNNDIFGITMGDTATADAFGATCIQIPNFSDGSNDRVSTSLTGDHADSGKSDVFLDSRRWNNTAAITAFSLLPGVGTNFHSSSMLSTYAVPKNLIERQELSGAASSVTFSSIPQTYDHLELSIYVRGDSSGQPEAGFKNEFNGDTTVANYKRQHLIAYGTTVGAGQGDSNQPVDFPTTTATANVFSSIAYSIQNYTKTDRHKHYMVTAGDAGENELRLTSNRWANTAAISSIVFTPSAGNFIAGSVFTLRGINSTVAAATSDVAALNSIAPADIEAVN